MKSIAIQSTNLSKLYRIGQRESYYTLRDLLARGLDVSLRRLRASFRSAASGLRSSVSGLGGLGDDSVTPNLNDLIPNTQNHLDPGPNHIWALKDVSFEVKRGEVVGVIGRNGAGKTTLLKVLSRITEPTRGRVKLYGRLGSLLEVGTGFHPELTGRENIYLNGAILGMKKREIESKFDEIVSFAEVERFVDTPVKRYSSGMSVRLAFAVAAHLQPQILLVDEVLAVGDVEFQKKCIGKMEKIANEGKTALVVSHNMSTVKALCTRAMLLEGGVMKAIGLVDDVVAQYLSGGVDVAEKVVSDEDHDVGGGSAIRVKRIRLLNEAMNSFSVYWQQPISVSLEIRVFQHIEDVSFGAAIRMPDGTIVFVSYNDDGGRPQWTLESGEYTVMFTLQNPLKSGLYTLHLGAYQRYAIAKNLFAVDAVNIEVLGFTKEGLVPSAADPGLVSGFKSVFSCKKLGSDETLK